MTRSPVHDALTRLGLPGLQPSDTTHLTWAASGESQARGLVPAAVAFTTLAASGFVDVGFAAVATPALGRLEAAVSAPGTRVLRVAAPRGHLVHVHGPADLSVDHITYRPEEDPGTVYVDLSTASTVLVRGGADAVLLHADDTGVAVTAVTPQPHAMSTLEVPPSLAPWLAACQDAWLVEQATPLAVAADPWSSVIAAGMLARLTTPASPVQAREWLDAARHGHVDESVAGPRRWARALPAADLARLEAQAVADAAALRLDIEDAVDDVDRSVAGWEDVVREVAHRRDDLEGVLLLLDAAGAAAALRDVLAAVDRDGAVLRLAVGDAAGSDDERLRRVGLKDPDAWWAHAG